MSDIVDLAEAREAQMRADALAIFQHQQALRQTGISLEECTECGEDIPLARQQAVPGVSRCVRCQGILEQRLNR